MKYAVAWVSPRGFANEGQYLYGEIDKVKADKAFQDAVFNPDATSKIMSRHKTMDGAEFTASERLKRDRIPYRGHIGDLNIQTRRVGDE